MKRTYDNIINTEGAIKTNLSGQNRFINNSETKHIQILPLQLQIKIQIDETLIRYSFHIKYNVISIYIYILLYIIFIYLYIYVFMCLCLCVYAKFRSCHSLSLCNRSNWYYGGWRPARWWLWSELHHGDTLCPVRYVLLFT